MVSGRTVTVTVTVVVITVGLAVVIGVVDMAEVFELASIGLANTNNSTNMNTVMIKRFFMMISPLLLNKRKMIITQNVQKYICV